MKIVSARLLPLAVLAGVLSWSLQIAPARSQEADLSVTKTVSAPSAVEGAELTYTITLTNNGPDAASNASITDTMQFGNTFHAARISLGSYTFNTLGGIFSANFGALFVGQSATAVLEVVPVMNAALQVTAPVSIAGDYPAGQAVFGPALTLQGLPGLVVAAVPALACSALTNPAEIAGRIALIDRGTCSFSLKVKFAQDAGAIGVIFANQTDTIANMAAGTADIITIPSLMVSSTVGNSIKAVLSEGVSASLALSFTQERMNTVSATAPEVDPDFANNSATVVSTILRDTDGDLTPDNADPCPSDPLKVSPGFCGCGTQDLDGDGSGAIDCLYTNELAGRANAIIVSVSQLKMVNGRIKNLSANKARINALLLETSTYLNAHAGQITLSGPTVNPTLLLRSATGKTKAVLRSNASTFRTAKSAAIKALKLFLAGLTPI